MGFQRIALIADLHGNLPALTATLADIDRRGIGRIICLGDLAGKGPDGAAVVDICQERCAQVVRGNWDDGLAREPAKTAHAAWQQARLGPGRLAYLGSLPNTVDFRLGNHRVRLLHASPDGVEARVFPDAPAPVLRSMFDNTDFTGPGCLPDVVGYADIHEPFLLTLETKTLFNVGSVGNPLDLPLACYGIIEGGDPNDAASLAISVARLPYDIEQAVADAERVRMPNREKYAIELRTAVYQGRMVS